MKYNILLADDDASIRFVLSKYLTRAGFGVMATDNPKTLLKWTEAGEGDIVLTDVHMGTDEIFSYIPQLKAKRPNLPIIVISANTRMVTALKSRQSGVFEYIPKPFDLSDLENTIQRALGSQIKPQPQTPEKQDQMIGRSKAMQPVFKAISDYASGDIPIFIWGDAGTGKNLAAQCVHDASVRSETDLINFTKYENSSALVADARCGDVFVDRVHELSMDQQTNLLEIFELNENRALGDKLRVIATSELSLEHITESQLLRADLLSYLMGAKIYLPPLCERAGDLGDLATHFLKSAQPERQSRIKPSALVRLMGHTWPGNVRELKNLMQVIALQFSDADITVDIINHMLHTQNSKLAQDNPLDDIKSACANLLHEAFINNEHIETTPYEQALEWIEKPLIYEALDLTGGNNSKAADLLGIHRNTLRTKLRKWQID